MTTDDQEPARHEVSSDAQWIVRQHFDQFAEAARISVKVLARMHDAFIAAAPIIFAAAAEQQRLIRQSLERRG